MKKIVKLFLAILSLSALTNAANAANPGAYVGLGLGASRIESPNKDLALQNEVTSQNLTYSHSLGGFGGRVFAGYNFNRYFGVEAGFAQYAQSKYTISSPVNNAHGTLKYTMNALDVVGKAYLPISETGFNLYALGGAARVNSEQKFTLSASGFKGNVSQTTHKIRPVYGVGASYDVSAHVTTNLEFSHIQGTGSKSNVPSANMVTLGLAYNFG